MVKCLLFASKMDIHGLDNFAIPIPILPLEVVHYDRIPYSSWITEAVTPRNEVGEDVTNGICQSAKAKLVINEDGTSLIVDRVAVQNAGSLCKAEVLSAWMWSMHV